MRLIFLVVGLFLFLNDVQAQTYQGDGILKILGQVKDSSDIYKAFAREWTIGRKISLPEKGFKLSKNYDTQRVTALFFAGKGFEVGNAKFEKFSDAMPFGLSMDDDINVLLAKLGTPKKTGEDYAKFSKNGLVILAKFRNKSKTKLEYVKISLAFGQLTYSPDFVEEEESEEVEISPPAVVEEAPVKVSTTVKVSNRDKVGISETLPADFSSSTSSRMNTTTASNKSAVYRAIMRAMKSGSESYFETIKSTSVNPITNFWNYKYTFATTLKIPDEKYNFIYSFPFATSQRDFVSVLKEGVYDESFKTTYDKLLAQLKSDFTASEGWKVSYPKDGEVGFQLKDVEFQNERYGSVVLDYHKKPTGQSVLYLRFILYYD